MKAKKLQLFYGKVRICSFLFLMIVIAQCTGPTGPMGPKGDDGQDGLDGLDGINYVSSVNMMLLLRNGLVMLMDILFHLTYRKLLTKYITQERYWFTS